MVGNICQEMRQNCLLFFGSLCLPQQPCWDCFLLHITPKAIWTQLFQQLLKPQLLL